MAAFQLLEAMVALAGDDQQILHRGTDNPITYPELLMLTYIHGEDAVTDAFEVGRVERENQEELDRLRRTFGEAAAKDVFPGTRPRLPLQDSRIRPRQKATAPKRKPLPQRNEDRAAEGELVVLDDEDNNPDG